MKQKKRTQKHFRREKMVFDGNIYQLQSWMFIHKDYDGMVTKEFLNDLDIFMYQAGNTPIIQETNKILCSCPKCKNTKFARRETILKYLVNRGFTPTVLYLIST